MNPGALTEIACQWQIPEQTATECLFAHRFFPELHDIRIRVSLKSLRTTMAARPEVLNLLRSRKKRKYNVYINNDPRKARGVIWNEMPKEALTGIIGHELIHILDYTQSSNLKILLIGLKYITSHSFKRRFERATDLSCIRRGMGAYLLAFQQYIDGNSRIEDSYKANLRMYYMTAGEIADAVIINR
ncbi:MAG: hypothetical protein KKD31_02020 [Bacteroidetes bacterium]|nr:hypothetical protein [Bacteroidota bacterium]